MSVNSKMTALADKIRVLSGTEDAMGLDDMATNVGNANTEVDSQADLIAQIKSTIDNLPEAGSSGNSFPYTVTVNTNMGISSVYHSTDEDELIVLIRTQMGQPKEYTITGGTIYDRFTINNFFGLIIVPTTNNIILNITYEIGDFQ